jgi:hypothetical protein
MLIVGRVVDEMFDTNLPLGTSVVVNFFWPTPEGTDSKSVYTHVFESQSATSPGRLVFARVSFNTSDLPHGKYTAMAIVLGRLPSTEGDKELQTTCGGPDLPWLKGNAQAREYTDGHFEFHVIVEQNH